MAGIGRREDANSKVDNLSVGWQTRPLGTSRKWLRSMRRARYRAAMSRPASPLSESEESSSDFVERPLSSALRWWVLIAAFSAWLFAGVQMSVTPLIANSATRDFLRTDERPDVPKPVLTDWFARYNATFLLGAAAGGILFGWIGDRFGRAKALAASVCCYTLFSWLVTYARTPEQFVALRFVGCLGIGGAWPNGIALASEVWGQVSRPVLAGIIGTAANVGLVLMGILGVVQEITADSWRWVMYLGAIPVVLGIAMFFTLPESPKWLAARRAAQRRRASAREEDSPIAVAANPVAEVFRPPLLKLTLLGILLGAIPLFGGWGCTNWLVPWADQVGAATDPKLKAMTQIYRSLGAAASSLAGGWVAARLGRRLSYFLFSVASLAIGQHIYRNLDPLHADFGIWVFMLGTTTGFYFGWLPLCLPELFPTRVRSTGAGVTFNTGRVATALGVLGAGLLSRMPAFDGDYGKIGSVTSLIFAAGMLAIWLMPRGDERREMAE